MERSWKTACGMRTETNLSLGYGNVSRSPMTRTLLSIVAHGALFPPPRAYQPHCSPRTCSAILTPAHHTPSSLPIATWSNPSSAKPTRLCASPPRSRILSARACSPAPRAPRRHSPPTTKTHHCCPERGQTGPYRGTSGPRPNCE